MYVLWQVITTVLHGTWRTLTFIRQFILNIMFILLVSICIGVWLQNERVHTGGERHKGALIVNLQGIVVDKPAINDHFLMKIYHQILGHHGDYIKETSLFQIVNSIRQAKDDPQITGMVLDLDNFVSANQSSLEYIGKALSEFRKSGKPIFAFGLNYTQTQYYLASFANKIYLSPYGSVDIRGFSFNNIYYKSFLQKLKVHSHVFRVGAYKSAVEPLLRDNMSPEACEANHLWVTELWNNYLNTLAENRKVKITQIFPSVKKTIEKLEALHGDSAQYAKENGLVDILSSSALVEKELVNVFGWDVNTKNYYGVNIYDYPLKNTNNNSGNIAVITVSGSLVNDQLTPGRSFIDSTIADIRSARLDPAIKAIILRINSPGGSLSASETIRSELEAVRASGKPIVVSMGGMAASGAYWISTPANYIIANRNTLTGSIGIFNIINTIEDSLDMIGIHSDGIKSSKLAGTSHIQALSEDMQKIIQLNINHSYQDFINLVASARHKTRDEIDKVAQGRVWTGLDAKKYDLVDALGDFDDALAKAMELGHIKKIQLKWYDHEPYFLDLLYNQTTSSMHIALLQMISQGFLPKSILNTIIDIKKQPGLGLTMNDPQNLYALCFSCGDIL
ncbi:signal peptide peptidase SppA [Candidatus Erwinia haradaeae]|uniref:Protease 4 n=1 Tax=Candidatus Erwinia haradaeae TaxID=1922217 RepID=A0A451DFZ6_9GAMM|nr:signal peptide peptidase SppA [Candidatus Erwinia haradaeae]VFP85553.1 Protease 4 [Candidatus Erwinia haradaeae]